MAIDDYYADPENWDPKPYMRELEAVGNRGYTLAFHEGRLTNYAHDYEHTASLALWEYAGVVTDVTEDAFLVEVKNKLVAGEVLEFVSPIARETVLLRVYDFEKAANGERVPEVHGSNRTVIRLPFTLFDHENLDDLKARFPAFTVLRKERALTDEQWNRVRFDKLVQGLEVTGKDNPKAYERRRDALVESIGEGADERRLKTNRVGTEGCCGKGCNGCLMFWQDPQYERARDVLLKRKQGEQLTRAEASELKQAV
jgi:putative protease